MGRSIAVLPIQCAHQHRSNTSKNLKPVGLGVIYVSSVSINQTDTQCIQCISKPGAGLHTPATPLDAAPPPRSAGAPPPHPAHAHPRTRHYLHRTPTSPGAGSGAGDGDGASLEDEERDARSGLGFIARGFVTDDRYIDR